MALTRRQFAEKLRTMQRGGSKAPMQNVQLPTQTPNTSYKTPSGPAASAPQPQKTPGTDPVTLAKAGGLLGQIGKGLFNRPDTMALDNASSANLGQISNMMGLLQGSNVDVAANMAGNTAGNLSNLPQPSLLGNGVPVPDGLNGVANASSPFLEGGSAPIGAELGNLGAVNSAVANATDAASAATDATANASSWGLPAGAMIGAGLSVANGQYGKAAGQAVGGAAGSYFGPAGTFLGSQLGGWFGGRLG